MTPRDNHERFVAWLADRAIRDARGDDATTLSSRPDKRLWLGRLAPQDAAWRSGMGERARRLDPCSMGIRFRPRTWSWHANVSFVLWMYDRNAEPPVWRKSQPIEVDVDLEVPATITEEPQTFGEDAFARALDQAGHGENRAIRFEVEVEREQGVLVANVSLVNFGDDQAGRFDPNLYEVKLALEVGNIDYIELDALPDSFRYDRRIAAFGLYCGVEHDTSAGILRTSDFVAVDRQRPEYWDDTLGSEPDLTFVRLTQQPSEPLTELADALERWGERNWAAGALDARQVAESWTPEMRSEANLEAGRFAEEVRRVRAGVSALSDPDVERAFCMTNRAFLHSGSHRGYDRSRSFQLGFLLTVLPSLADPDHAERDTVDTLWFATGGGKTETYLAAVVFTCLYDRLRGKEHGISAWSRFPLRMLSLQQTQRFADVLAGAELARRDEGLDGDPIGLGFLVGGPPNGTPNRIRDDGENNGVDPGDPAMPARHKVLLHCPFCFSGALEMRFSRRTWRLMHVCTNDQCPWEGEGLPFHVVDEEIYRFLPSVVIGTMDKAASISIQAANRGLYASPIARCDRDGHGFSYAPRSKSPEGCLVPGCTGKRMALGQPIEMFAPSLRAQDELHLLRDSLGAVDSHYETLLDHLHRRTKSPIPKLVASSATLAGYDAQVDTLYKRPAGIFPLQGPMTGASYWSRDGDRLGRRFVGLAPRGVTLDFANDRLAESLQKAVRQLISEPEVVCREAGIDKKSTQELIDYYGVHVVYGNKLRDVEAAARSFAQQPGVTPLNVATLTGRTPLDDVRETLTRLSSPKAQFNDRLHIVCASAMMSHGVDVDRFNVITLLGLPLATAEFIQTSARIGRRLPGLVFVLHRMGIERDASVFRSFRPFVDQGDRFIEPVAITRRSRRVLEHTFAGLFAARVLGIHEAKRVRQSKQNISTAKALRDYFQTTPIEQASELLELCDALCLDPETDDKLKETLRLLLERTYLQIMDVGSTARFIGEVTPSPPMRSLREIETQIPVYAREDA